MSTSPSPLIQKADLDSFTLHLKASNHIVALLGAGLSASSGLPTFRGTGGLWRNHDATMLATPEAFAADPGLVWQFYSYRRHMALKAQPNKAHYALAELAKRRENFLTLSQNVDGLSLRAGHPASKLHLLHGSLFDVKCTWYFCDYFEQDNFEDPIVPALAFPSDAFPVEPVAATAISGAEGAMALKGAIKLGTAAQQLDLSDGRMEIPRLNAADLPRCPKCHNGLLRPGVVWFGERLPSDTMKAVDQFITQADSIDLILVIGTSARVFPAAGYVDLARQKGARIAVINLDRADVPGQSSELGEDDWFFEGDAGVIVPMILQPIIGDL